MMDDPASNITERLRALSAQHTLQQNGEGAGSGGAAQDYLALTHAPLDYTDDWPEVECTVHVLDCSSLDL